MTLSELQAKMPGLTYPIEAFLNTKGIPYKAAFFGESTIDDANAEKAIQLFTLEMERKQEQAQIKQEQERLERDEEVKKKKAMSQMLITSGFNFDGYRIV